MEYPPPPVVFKGCSKNVFILDNELNILSSGQDKILLILAFYYQIYMRFMIDLLLFVFILC